MTPCVINGLSKGVFWMRACGPSPRGMVLTPPLIGGHALMQLRLLRPLVRRGFDLISFNYAGHGESRGRFSFQAALDNTLDIFDLALDRCRALDVPLYGLASCFAAIPMLHAISERHQPMARMVLINAVPQLRGENLAGDFLRFWCRRGLGRPTSRVPGAALEAYLNDLFPQIASRGRGFGTLARHRIQWLRMVRELFSLRHLNRDPLSDTPVLCIYGRHDRLLQQMGFADWSRYESTIARICPQAEFRPMDGDHFLSGSDVRSKLMAVVARYLCR